MIDFIHKYHAADINFTNHQEDYLNEFNFYIPSHSYLSLIPDYIIYPYKTWEKTVWKEKIDLLSSKFAETGVKRLKTQYLVKCKIIYVLYVYLIK